MATTTRGRVGREDGLDHDGGFRVVLEALTDEELNPVGQVRSGRGRHNGRLTVRNHLLRAVHLVHYNARI